MNFVTGNPYPTNSFDEPQQPIAALVVIRRVTRSAVFGASAAMD
jgi:hypothetical protein